MPPVITIAVEGVADEAVALKLVAFVGAETGAVYGKQGKAHLRRRISAYNNAVRHAPWLMIVDLDREADCAPPLRQAWIPDPAPLACFRVAVRAIEAWLIADAQALAGFLSVDGNRIPENPETLDDPKRTMVNLARESRRKAIFEDMVPRPESGRRVGPAYSSRLVEFASQYWRPEVAARRADSLGRAIRALQQLILIKDRL